MFDWVWTRKQIGGEMLLALPLVVVSSVLYTRFPYKSKVEAQFNHSPASTINLGPDADKTGDEKKE